MKNWHVVVIALVTIYAWDLLGVRNYLPGLK